MTTPLPPGRRKNRRIISGGLGPDKPDDYFFAGAFAGSVGITGAG